MVHQINTKNIGKKRVGQHKVSKHKVAIRSSSDIGDAFWNIESGRTLKYGYTPRGVRDKIINRNGVVDYLLWDNHIASFDKNKNILTIRDTGWKTKLTKERLDSVLSSKFGWGKGSIRLQQERFVWYLVSGDDKKYEWSDTDNKIDINNPTKYLKPIKEEEMKTRVKEQAKISRDFVRGWKKKIFEKTATPQELDKLYGIFDARGRPPHFASMFLQDETGHWDFERLKEHWGLIRWDLLWHIKRKIQRGEV